MYCLKMCGMNPIIDIRDGVFRDIDAARDSVLAQQFGDITNPLDGVVYPGICPVPDPVAHEMMGAIEFLMGRDIVLRTAFCRATYGSMVATNKIHSDLIMGTYAAHVYLSPEWPDGAGTSFFANKALGMRHRPGVPPESVRPNHPEDWEKYCSVQAKLNRLLIHRGDAWHLAEPVGGWGSSPADGRLVITMFFEV